MKVLFICNQNKHRSKTAEEVFKRRWKTRSAGLYNEYPVTKKDIEWADSIIVMENEQRKVLAQRFPELYLKKKILCLDIPDVYQYNQEELKEALKIKVMVALS